MKKLTAYIFSHLLFYMGDLISKTWNTKLNKEGRGYSFYCWCMRNSVSIQDWAKNETPWKKYK